MKIEESTNEQTHKILYGAWKNMEYRCYNPKHEYYHIYGGRGIKVCDEWLGEDGLENFTNWALLNGHEKGLSLERVNNDGNYEPSNCKWATTKEQGKNRMHVLEITIDGITKNGYEWCRIYNLNYGTFLNRRNALGWDDVKSITTPVKLRKNPKGFEERTEW